MKNRAGRIRHRISTDRIVTLIRLAGLLLGLTHSPSAQPQSCGHSVLLDVMTVSGSQPKLGRPGFVSGAAPAGQEPARHYLSHETDFYEFIRVSGSERSYQSLLTRNEQETHPRDGMPLTTCLPAPPQTRILGYVESSGDFVSGCESCEAELIGDEWIPNDACATCHRAFVENVTSQWPLEQTLVTDETRQSIEWRYSTQVGSGTLAFHYEFVRRIDQRLSREYTVSDMVHDLVSKLQTLPWPNTWTGQGNAELRINPEQTCAHASRLRYRFRFIGSAGTAGKLDWTEQFIPADGGSLVENSRSVTVTFNGQIQTLEGVIEPPPLPGRIRILPAAPPPCPTCVPGQIEFHDDGLHLTFSLGTQEDGGPGGFVYVDGNDPDMDWDMPGLLEAFVPLDTTDVVTNGAGVRQIQTGNVLLDADRPESNVLVLIFYPGQHLKDPESNLYRPETDAISTYVLERISLDPPYVRVSKDDQILAEYFYFEGAWTRVQDEGQILTTHIRQYDSAGILRTNQILWQDGQFNVLRAETRQYTVLPDDDTPRLARERIGLGDEAELREWLYETNVPANDINFGRMRFQMESHGPWQRYDYHPILGLPERVVTGYLDQSPQSPDHSNHVLDLDYEPVVPEDDGSLEPETPRFEVERLLGVEVARRYRIITPETRREITCLEPRTPWYDSNNLVSTTWGRAHTNGWERFHLDHDGLLRRDHWETNGPNGWLLHQRQTGAVLAPPPDGSLRADSIQIQWLNGRGQPLTNQTWDVPSGILTADRRYEYDAFGRLTREEDLVAATRKTSMYDCCQRIQTEENGTTTFTQFDALGRIQSANRNGIVISNVWDAAGQLIEQWRVGQDGTSARIAAYRYDSAGRILAVIDPLDHTTYHHRERLASGGVAYETVRPDDSTIGESYYRDGALFAINGSGAFPRQYHYGVDPGMRKSPRFELETHPNLGSTEEWIRTHFDSLGRAARVTFPDGSGPEPSRAIYDNSYDPSGRPVMTVSPGGSAQMHRYDPAGHLVATGYDLDGNGLLETQGSDFLVTHAYTYEHLEGWPVAMVRTHAYPRDGQSHPILIASFARSLDGTRAWSVDAGRTNRTVASKDSEGRLLVENQGPNGHWMFETRQGDRVLSVRHESPRREIVAATNYQYDAHGRLASIEDTLRGRRVFFTYDAADRVIARVLAMPGRVDQTELTAYDSLGRVTRTRQFDGTWITNSYLPHGLPETVSGAGSYAVGYGYDDQGRLRSLRWLSDVVDGAPPFVSWTYDDYRGWRSGKHYPDGTQTVSEHGPDGQLESFANGRGDTLHHRYDPTGRFLVATLQGQRVIQERRHDRRGRPTLLSTPNTQVTRAYHESGLLALELHTNDFLDGVGIAFEYDPARNLSGIHWRGVNSAPILYQRDTVGSTRVLAGDIAIDIQLAFSPVPSTNYAYLLRQEAELNVWHGHPNDSPFESLIIRAESTQGIQWTWRHDHDSSGRWRQSQLPDGRVWRYAHDTLDRIQSASMSWPDGVAVPGCQFRYEYDHASNRRSAARGADVWGRGFLYEHFAANALNQYIQRSAPGAFHVIGEAPVDAVVTVHDQRAQRRQGFFHALVPLDNSLHATTAVWRARAVIPGEPDLVQEIELTPFAPHSPEIYQYDADGNLLADGRWHYEWDAENRLLEMRTRPTLANIPSRRITFLYDAEGRRTQRRRFDWREGAWQLTQERNYLYAGWLLLGELDEHRQWVAQYVWSPESFEETARGPVRPHLLARGVQSSGSMVWHAVVSDIAGNVVGLFDLSQGQFSAVYEYGPFGELIRATGPQARLNPIRFASQYQDDATGLVYFGRRYYRPETGRWLSRDPLEEEADLNLYVYAGNDPLHQWDWIGLEAFPSITMKRKRVLWLAILRAQLGKKSHPDDPYGHWWIEMGGESYGWWPRDPVGLLQTLAGVPGQLNGTVDMHAAGIADATRDGHHGDTADVAFHPQRRKGFFGGAEIKHGAAAGRGCDCVSEAEIQDCLRVFAGEYRGNWSFPWGRNCHSFQRSAMRACCLKR